MYHHDDRICQIIAIALQSLNYVDLEAEPNLTGSHFHKALRERAFHVKRAMDRILEKCVHKSSNITKIWSISLLSDTKHTNNHDFGCPVCEGAVSGARR